MSDQKLKALPQWKKQKENKKICKRNILMMAKY